MICSACANATCSERCHYHHVAVPGHCHFFTNFHPTLADSRPSSLPSISLKMWLKLVHKNAPPFTRIGTGSDQMLSAYITGREGPLLLQRGFRQYGNPLGSTLRGLREVAEDGLDFHLFNRKACFCDCKKCRARGVHSLANCESDCQDDTWAKFRSSK